MVKMGETPMYLAEEIRRPSASKLTPFQQAFDAARAAKKKDFEFPPKSGRRFSTQTAEEQGREIGAKAAAGSGRGASAGRTAADRDTTAVRRDTIPGAGPYKAPASTGEGMSETRRNIANIVSALPAARAVSMAGKAAQTAAASRAASEGAKRITPMLATSGNAGTGKFRNTQGSLKESTEAAMKSRPGPEMGAGAKSGRAASESGRVEPMLSTSRASDSGKFRKSDVSLKEATEAAKKGRTEPTFKKGGSVRGAGCEARNKKTRYV